ncbi:DUF3617 family protein [Methylopila sp. M107]|uniref:DUF3617 domain-containing protein n=1 Tax=Methylopila sp. M107 TaxID=1101190 RepID=UPI0003646432|nr:DUF3617 family protein [Methylopila sp. M107]
MRPLFAAIAATATFVAVLSGAGVALAYERVPTRTPGLWESATITNAGRTTVKECVDERTDRLVLQLVAVLTCKNTDFKRTEDGYAAGARCSAGGMTVDNKITVTGDFDQWARAEALTTMTSTDDQSALNRTFSTAIETRRLGDCAEGQIPGDIVLPGGKTVHVNPSNKR